MKKIIMSGVISFNLLYGSPPSGARTATIIPMQTTTISAPYHNGQNDISIEIIHTDIEGQNVETHNHRKCCGRWSKKQVSCFVAIAGLGATGITAIASLIIYFNNCSNT